MFHIKNRKALSMIEAMLAVAIFAIFSIGIFNLSIDLIQRDLKVQLEDEALSYAQEGLEAVRNIRDQNYLLLENGTYGLDFTDDLWTLTVAPENIDEFYERTILIEDVYRDVDGEIASSGTVDPYMKKITSSVDWTWRLTNPKTVSLTTYFSEWPSDEWMQTTCTEFAAGTLSDTDTVETASPPEDNCALQLRLVEEPSGFFSSINIGEHADDVDIENDYAFVATAKDFEGLVIADIADRNSPTVLSTVDVDGKGRSVLKDGDYVFMGVFNDSEGLAIVDVTDYEAPFLVGQYDTDAYGNEIVVDGNYLYMGIEDDDNSFLILNVSSKSSPSLVSSVDVDAKVRAVYLDGDYAYIGVDDSNAGFQIVDVSSPGSPSVVSTLDLSYGVTSIDVIGIFAFVGIDSTSNSLQVINISDPNNPSVVASLNTGEKIRDISIQDDYLYAAMDSVSNGLGIINISSPVSPYVAYIADITGKATATVTDNNYVYLGLDINNRGIVILETVSTRFMGDGTFQSAVLDTGSADTRYNFIDFDVNEVPGGTVQFQIRTSSTAGNLTTATWVGSDGTSSSYYDTTPTAIVTNPSATGTRYFQFKAYMESDTYISPQVESVTINYNP